MGGTNPANPNSLNMATISSYSFGRMCIGECVYTSDLIIYPDGRVADKWWRQSGHQLSTDDIGDLLAAHPEHIIVGTGAYGIMKIEPSLTTLLADMHIVLQAMPSPEAVEAYNLQPVSEKTGACFHLTC